MNDLRRFIGGKALGVGEHIWHRVNPVRRGSKALTGIVHLTRNNKGRVQVRLLELFSARKGIVYAR